MPVQIQVEPLGDSCVLIRLGEGISEELHKRVMAFAASVEQKPFAGFIECVPAYASVAVHYNPLIVWKSRTGAEIAHETIVETVAERLRPLAHLSIERTSGGAEGRIVEIPVCYGGEFGPDLEEVAKYCGMRPEETIKRHSDATYLVYMIGFAPGFPYLGGMPQSLAVPRRSTPRTRIPSGSVAIGGAQTGIYPVATPGGWHIVGRTPLMLFRPQQEPPTLLMAGDRIRFVPISARQFAEWDPLSTGVGRGETEVQGD
ncbi:5-oxoprolinase subunit PxpB [Paenibacillus sp. GCM10027627]|uniref:5-oxoprolinase subunit PxpB n=1 Tax=unclassified Paenibacillus TaxID=185978 RepID=UPI00363E7761